MPRKILKHRKSLESYCLFRMFLRITASRCLMIVVRGGNKIDWGQGEKFKAAIDEHRNVKLLRHIIMT